MDCRTLGRSSGNLSFFCGLASKVWGFRYKVVLPLIFLFPPFATSKLYNAAFFSGWGNPLRSTSGDPSYSGTQWVKCGGMWRGCYGRYGPVVALFQVAGIHPQASSGTLRHPRAISTTTKLRRGATPSQEKTLTSAKAHPNCVNVGACSRLAFHSGQ